MKRFCFLSIIILVLSCESEKLPYHCAIPGEQDGSISDINGEISDIVDASGYAGNHLKTTILSDDAGFSDTDEPDSSYSDITKSDTGVSDIISGRPCSTIGISTECGPDESCYPFIECGGICRKCGNLTAGSACEIHSDCKCQMACLALTDRELKCYKICNNNSDCPSGQTCTDGWGTRYEHEYFKICKGTNTINTTKEEGK